MLSMASGAKIYSGTYIPESSGTALSIDVGSSNFSHFLLVPHSLPYETAYVRCLGGRYVDLEQHLLLIMIGASSEKTYPSSTNMFTDETTTTFDHFVSKNGSILTFITGIAAQIGTLYANTQYDWYAW